VRHIRKTSSLVATAVAIAILAMLVFAPGATGAQSSGSETHSAGFTSVPVTGVTPSGNSFRGVMNITRFAPVGENLAAVGNITGTSRNASGGIVRTVANAPAQLPVTEATSSCTILHLVLGPLDLDLLGLHVHLNRVVLDITANQGPGQLLGNLLCALAHLLDGGQANVLSQLLTAVVRIVGALGLLN
jgi:hypothetical protein